MAQTRSEMPLPRKIRHKEGPRQDRLLSQSNLRAHCRIYATYHSQTFCKSLPHHIKYKNTRLFWVLAKACQASPTRLIPLSQVDLDMVCRDP